MNDETDDTPKLPTGKSDVARDAGRYVFSREFGIWPKPLDVGDVERTMRYTDGGKIADVDRLTAAAFIVAYRRLIYMPQKKRELVCKLLKAAGQQK